ncbi:hypothetical protein BWK59_09050 [Flavobacterium davisii]|uniref:Uncharacterized protein n=1 Tax=Flavobacterium davisii TaxID=2906077 RepID=A0A246GHN1_9FLAO|nr:hypothetical protein [Flavobacterium davisii]OWP83711.1 hypothetical protein BWK59_09050 [Flavobacterium davisii]
MNELFEHPNRVVFEVDNDYFIYDNKTDEKTDFVDENSKWNLKIEVRKYSLFIDNERFIMNQAQSGMKKCDWICFNDSDCYFIESKDVKTKLRKAARTDFDEKIEDTIQFYKKYNLSHLNLWGVLNFRSPNKVTSAASKDRKFKYNLKGIKYEELNCLQVL